MRKKSRDYRGGTLHVEPRKQKFNTGILYEALSWIGGIVISFFLGVFLVYSFGIRSSVIGASMEPLLGNGQEVLINRIAYQFRGPQRGDIVVFHPNGNPNTHLYVKRVLGIPGDKIQIKQGKLFINGELYRNDYSSEIMEPGIAANEITLDLEEYFVLGDHRAESEDSRSSDIGPVSRSMIEGRVWFRMGMGEDVKMGRIE